MKKYSYVSISFIILVFGIIFVPRIIDRIQNTDVTKSGRSGSIKGEKEKLSFIKINDEHKKVPDFAFINQDSLPITNHDFKGKVYIAEFFFASCPTICPKMTKNLVYLQDQLKDEKDFGIASFTITPDRDTPKVLKKYAEHYGVKNPDWHFLTGDREKVYELANKGFNLYAADNPNAPGGFEHSGYFALIDKNGFIRSRYDQFGNPIIFYRGTVSVESKKDENGEGEQITMLLEDIKKLLKE